MAVALVHSKRVTAADLGSRADTVLAIWLFFQIAADHILLPLLVATFLFSRSIVRHSTVISVCCTWIVAGVASCLLFYTGQHVGPEPDIGLCIAQAALMVPIPPMASVAVLALVYNTWTSFRPHNMQLGGKRHTVRSRLLTVMLLAAPYITYIIFASVAAQFAIRHPERVNRERAFFYCSVQWDEFNKGMAIFTAIICLVATILAAHTATMLSRTWRALRAAGHATGIDLQLTLRVSVFVIYVLLGAVAMLAVVFDSRSVYPDMYAASIGMVFFLVFASQPAVLRVWFSWLPVPRLRRARDSPNAGARTRASSPPFDPDLLRRTDSEVSEKARLAALHAYYSARVHEVGAEVEVIQRPQDAFVADGLGRPDISRRATD